jgi:hypothetical protein
MEGGYINLGNIYIEICKRIWDSNKKYEFFHDYY